MSVGREANGTFVQIKRTQFEHENDGLRPAAKETPTTKTRNFSFIKKKNSSIVDECV